MTKRKHKISEYGHGYGFNEAVTKTLNDEKSRPKDNLEIKGKTIPGKATAN